MNDPASFKTWAYRITTNKSIDWIKKGENAKHLSIEEVQSHPNSNKRDIGIKELLEKLDIRKKAVLYLYYFEQLSVSEIGTALKIPDGTVKSRLANARKELKELWQKCLE